MPFDFAFTFCALTAVSSEDQATEDKDSLDNQLKTVRNFGERMGGTFTREYRADGFTRSGWYDLTPALEQCQGFGELARDARLHSFDVVLVENYDRLGDIGNNFFNFFSSLGSPYIQLRSVLQTPMVEDPAIYHPRRDETIPNAIADALKNNKNRTNKIFRAFAVGNSRRARDGKYAMRVPLGYIKTADKEAEIDSTTAPLIAKFPDWLLSGCTVAEIQRRAEDSGIAPGWSHRRITYILENPFYAGKTFYDRSNDGELYDGKHEPLWSYETYLKVQEELARRRGQPRAKKTDYNFTSLITCSECGTHLQIGYSSDRPQYKYWYCRRGHVTISTRKANRMVADEMRRLFADKSRNPQPRETPKDYTDRQLRQLDFELKRLEAAYYAGAYTPEQFADKKRGIDTRRKELQDDAYQAEAARNRAESRLRAFRAITDILPHLEQIFESDHGAEINYQLRQVIRLTAHPDKTITAELAG